MYRLWRDQTLCHILAKSNNPRRAELAKNSDLKSENSGSFAILDLTGSGFSQFIDERVEDVDVDNKMIIRVVKTT